MGILKKITSSIDRLSGLALWLAALGAICLVILTTEEVLSRYFFQRTSSALFELQWHFSGTIFLLGLPAALRDHEHVRVDPVYSKLSQRWRDWIDIGGSLFFLIPFAAIVAWYSFEVVIQTAGYENPRPDDFYTVQFFEKDGTMHQLLTPLEGFIRKKLLFGEISPTAGGLEGRWIIQSVIPISMVLLLLQGISNMLKCVARRIQPRQVDGYREEP